jgi:hypothetical protein
MSPSSSTSTSDGRLRAAAGLAAGFVGALLLAEALLRALPVPDGLFGADPDPAWPMHRLVPDSTYTYSMGWNLRNVHRGRINHEGYIAPFDYGVARGGVAVFGDSFVEAQMLPYGQTLQGRLPALLPAQPQVRHFGVAGASLADYLGTARLVGERFAPDHAVVVVSKGDFTEGLSAGPGYHAWAPENGRLVAQQPLVRKSVAEKAIRDLAIVRYLRGNLKFSPVGFLRPARVDVAGEARPCVDVVSGPADRELVERFAEALPVALDLPPSRIVYLFDADDRRDLYAIGPATPACLDRDGAARRLLATSAAAAGSRVVDLGPLFRADVAVARERLDFLPLDGHWNARGHAIAAVAAASALADSAAVPET